MLSVTAGAFLVHRGHALGKILESRCLCLPDAVSALWGWVLFPPFPKAQAILLHLVLSSGIENFCCNFPSCILGFVCLFLFPPLDCQLLKGKNCFWGLVCRAHLVFWVRSTLRKALALEAEGKERPRDHEDRQAHLEQRQSTCSMRCEVTDRTGETYLQCQTSHPGLTLVCVFLSSLVSPLSLKYISPYIYIFFLN